MRTITKLYAGPAICGILCCLGAEVSIHAGPTNGSPGQPQKPGQVETKFETNAVLTSSELAEVISLAAQCGISKPGEVRTFYWLPGGGKGVVVKSVERTNAADITFDEIEISKSGWTDFGASGTVKRVGGFWAEPSGKFTRHFRVYDFRGERIRVNIGKGITTDLADKVIPIIEAKKFRFSSKDSALQFDRAEMERMLGAKPSGLSKRENGDLWLHFEDQLDALQFRFEKGEVILVGVIHIVI